MRKAAKVLALDVSCPPLIQLEGSTHQFFGLKPKNWRAEPSSQIGGGHETSSANTLAAFTALLLPSLFCSITLPPAQQPPLPSNPLLLCRHFSRPPSLISSVACASPEASPVHHLFVLQIKGTYPSIPTFITDPLIRWGTRSIFPRLVASHLRLIHLFLLVVFYSFNPPSIF